jgi:hypothetical protein
MVMGSVAQREAPRLDVKRWALRGGWSYDGVALDRGQVFKLKGLINDAALVDLRYVGEVATGATTYPCRVCGMEFLEQGMRDAHGAKRHEDESRRRMMTPPSRQDGESQASYQNRLDEWALAAGRADDAKAEREDKQADAIAPLDMTKTQASRS